MSGAGFSAFTREVLRAVSSYDLGNGLWWEGRYHSSKPRGFVALDGSFSGGFMKAVDILR